MNLADRKELKIILAKYLEVDVDIGDLARTLKEIKENKEYDDYVVVDFKIVDKVNA